jgi:hypothetical protein
VSWRSANRQNHLSNQTSEQNPGISGLPDQLQETFARHVRPPIRTCLSLPFLLVCKTYLSPLPGSRKDFRICSAPGSDISGHPSRATTKSFCRTYLTGYPGSRGIPRTFLVPGPDMFDPSAFSRAKSVRRTCLVPRLGSSSVF